MFKEENALPRAELHSAVSNRNGFAGACEDHADVRWHVVAAFGAVREVIGVFRHETVEKCFQIAACRRVGIFHDDDAATGVLNKNGDYALWHAALIDFRLQVICDFIKTLAVRAHFEFAVVDVHAIHVIRRGPVSKTDRAVIALKSQYFSHNVHKGHKAVIRLGSS